MIEARDIVKKYRDKTAVDRLSFVLEENKVHGIVGPLGAGKSTLCDLIAGCLSEYEGSLTVNGFDMSKESDAAKRKIGYLPSIPPLYDNMTVEEYLAFVGEAKHVSYDKLYRNVKSVMELTDIENAEKKLIKNLSESYKKRVGIAQSLLGNPDIIVLDEPFEGVESAKVSDICGLITKLGRRKTIIISTAKVSSISDICDDLMIISHGKMIAFGSVESLERKLNRVKALRISIKGEEGQVLSALSEVSGLSDCTVMGIKKDTVSLKLEYDSEIEPRNAVLAALASAGCTVVSMEDASLTFDDILQKLTAADEETEEKSSDKKKKIKEKGGKI